MKVRAKAGLKKLKRKKWALLLPHELPGAQTSDVAELDTRD